MQLNRRWPFKESWKICTHTTEVKLLEAFFYIWFYKNLSKTFEKEMRVNVNRSEMYLGDLTVNMSGVPSKQKDNNHLHCIYTLFYGDLLSENLTIKEFYNCWYFCAFAFCLSIYVHPLLCYFCLISNLIHECVHRFIIRSLHVERNVFCIILCLNFKILMHFDIIII